MSLNHHLTFVNTLLEHHIDSPKCHNEDTVPAFPNGDRRVCFWLMLRYGYVCVVEQGGRCTIR